jgi:hypothetical protein
VPTERESLKTVPCGRGRCSHNSCEGSYAAVTADGRREAVLEKLCLYYQGYSSQDSILRAKQLSKCFIQLCGPTAALHPHLRLHLYENNAYDISADSSHGSRARIAKQLLDDINGIALPQTVSSFACPGSSHNQIAQDTLTEIAAKQIMDGRAYACHNCVRPGG